MSLDANGGTTYGGTGSTTGAIANPYTLTGTAIAQISDNMKAWASRAHRKASEQRNSVELWYWRDSTWSLFPQQPACSPKYPIKITRTYRQPTTLEAIIPDGLGVLTPEDQNSAVNYNASGALDPLLDVARKVLLRAGCWCYYNLAAGLTPTASAAVGLGSLAKLTDGQWADWTGSVPFDSGAAWSLSGTAPAIDITFDLTRPYVIRNVGIRFGTRIGGFALPATVTLQLSTDNVHWSSWPARPVGGPIGDWDESVSGQAVEIVMTDVLATAQYVRFHVVGTDGSSSLGVDEIAIWGGSSGSVLGGNVFVGYLGDEIDLSAVGLPRILATDATKKANDNSEAQLTAQFGATSTSPGPDIADIAWTLLTSTAYWRGLSGAYDAPYDTTEIGWAYGSALTGFPMPIYQGQTNTIYGYVLELFHMIGWVVGVDGNGVWQAYEPTYTQALPDRVLIAAPDGCNDIWNIQRHRTEKALRNVFEIAVGKSSQASAGNTVEFDPASVARYGHRRVKITDAIAASAIIRRKIAQYGVRDYAWRLQEITGIFRPDFTTRLREIHGIRATGRVRMYPLGSSVANNLRGQELWSVMRIEESITSGDWRADASYIPYVPTFLDPPTVVSLVSGSGSTSLTLTWLPYGTIQTTVTTGANSATQTVGSTNGMRPGDVLYFATLNANRTVDHVVNDNTVVLTASANTTTGETVNNTSNVSTNVKLASFNVYLSTVSDAGPWVIRNTSKLNTAFSAFGLTPGTQYWAYLTAVDTNGHESIPSDVLTTVIGTAADASGTLGGWVVTDLAASFNQVTGPDAQGYYTYEFYVTWTSPPSGFKRMALYFNIGSIPAGADKTSNWTYQDEWHGNFIPPGKTWDRVTTAPLTWYGRFRVASPIASTIRVFWRMQTSTTTNGWHNPQWSNICFGVIP